MEERVLIMKMEIDLRYLAGCARKMIFVLNDTRINSWRAAIRGPNFGFHENGELVGMMVAGKFPTGESGLVYASHMYPMPLIQVNSNPLEWDTSIILPDFGQTFGGYVECIAGCGLKLQRKTISGDSFAKAKFLLEELADMGGV